MSAKYDHDAKELEARWLERSKLFQALTELESEVDERRWATLQESERDPEWDRAVNAWAMRHGNRVRRRVR